MGKYFWPVFVAVAALSCAAVWRFVPDVRERICSAVDSIRGGNAVAQERDPPGEAALLPLQGSDVVAASCDPPGEAALQAPDAAAQKRAPPVRPVDPIHAAWGVLTDITPVEGLDGTPIGNVSGGRFFKIEKTISTPSGLMIAGTFIPQKKQQVVRIPADKISSLSGVPGFLSTNQQVCLRKYYELTGEAEALKTKLMREAAKKSPYLQDAADALRELRAKEKSVEKMRSADADTLRKTTYEISQLRVKVQELNQKHKEWKAEHAAELPDPEKDPAYLEIIDRRRRYAEAIPLRRSDSRPHALASSRTDGAADVRPVGPCVDDAGVDVQHDEERLDQVDRHK